MAAPGAVMQVSVGRLQRAEQRQAQQPAVLRDAVRPAPTRASEAVVLQVPVGRLQRAEQQQAERPTVRRQAAVQPEPARAEMRCRVAAQRNRVALAARLTSKPVVEASSFRRDRSGAAAARR